MAESGDGDAIGTGHRQLQHIEIQELLSFLGVCGQHISNIFVAFFGKSA
jgi:hypothetical protein